MALPAPRTDLVLTRRVDIAHRDPDRRWRADVAKREVVADNDNAPTLERVAFKTDLCDQLHRIACPALVIHGSKDAPFTAGAALLQRGLPHVRRVSFVGVGHHPLVEEHARTIAEIRTELADDP